MSGDMNAAFHIVLHGSVQGCGVRPAIVRLAQTLGISGWIANDADRVLIHVQGSVENLDRFQRLLPTALPPLARLDTVQQAEAQYDDQLQTFAICPARQVEGMSEVPELPADRALCSTCLQELLDPQARRYQWPFIACTQCGPRFAWLQRLPFVRANTTFSPFRPCAKCDLEYIDSESRRFGMELIACETCGPRLCFRDVAGELNGNQVWQNAVSALLAGGIVALQSFCGFHLLARASDENAVARLRHWKARPAKPLAMMVPTLQWAENCVHVSDTERLWLTGEHRPIVLLRKRDPQSACLIAPENPYLGVMLPHNGIQHLIMTMLGEAVVATSANRRGDPVAASLEEVLPWLGSGIDAICYHNIPIWQAQDDSVLAVLSDGPVLLRRARGFVHEILPTMDFHFHRKSGEQKRQTSVLADGAFLKNTFAIKCNQRAFVSQYLGDLESVAVSERKQQVVARMSGLCGINPARKIIDAHPDLALETANSQAYAVLHHQAHVAALIAEARVNTPALIAAWDGTGYGGSQQWWGSEVFLYQTGALSSGLAAGLTPNFGLQAFALPGGDKCSREPWRVLVALLLSSGVEQKQVLQFLQKQRVNTVITKNVHVQVIDALVSGITFPLATSMGRFLEALSALLLGILDNAFEAQAACRLEYMAGEVSLEGLEPYSFLTETDAFGVLRWQWQPMVHDLWQAVQADVNRQFLARRVLNTMVELLVQACLQTNTVMLGVSGGCFQNRYLLECLRIRCDQEGIALARPRRLPPNDGAISFGQLQLITG